MVKHYFHHRAVFSQPKELGVLAICWVVFGVYFLSMDHIDFHVFRAMFIRKVFQELVTYFLPFLVFLLFLLLLHFPALLLHQDLQESL
mmetsp:Transcript_43301/g.41698  ORF Transcript_43301/g.41698 Transcript_43301/m.41698 type:complete len:88 (+) Transcript_43301:1179-1442(+)